MGMCESEIQDIINMIDQILAKKLPLDPKLFLLVVYLFKTFFALFFFSYTHLVRGRGDGRENREKKLALLHVIVTCCLICCNLQTKI